LCADDLHVLVAARARQVAHDQAQLLADVFEAGLAAHQDSDTVVRHPDLVDRAEVQVAWTLHCSDAHAQTQILLGRALLRRLPMVWQALAEGRIDYLRAAAFADCLPDVDESTARAIAGLLLPRAEGWTVAQLRERLNYHVQRADPGLARRRYVRCVADRTVWQQPFTDGTAFLAGSNLPPHLAAAAYDHLDRLARAAKAGGDPRTLPQLRADAYLAMLAGVPFRQQPPTDPMCAEGDTAAAASGEVVDDPDDLAGRTPPPEPRHRPPRYSRRLVRDHQRDRDQRDRDQGARAAAQTGGGAGPDTSTVNPVRRQTTPTRMPSAPADTAPAQGTTVTAPAEAVTAQADVARAGVDGWPPDAWPDGPPPDEGVEDRHGPPDAWPTVHDGRISVEQGPGVDPATAPLGRASLGDDPDHRPPRGDVCCECGGVRPGDRRGSVELVVKLSTLAGLDNDPALIPGWGSVIADIARQVATDQHHRPAWRFSVTDEEGRLRFHGRTNRRPTAVEHSFVAARDQLCQSPGCRRPARNCDQDHRVQYRDHGPTHRTNLMVACETHHVLRHLPGYEINEIAPGRYQWITPNGLTYTTGPDHVLRLTAEVDNPDPSLYHAAADPSHAGHDAQAAGQAA
jgi:hypothetical protein